MKYSFPWTALFLFLFLAMPLSHASTVWMDDMDLSLVIQGWGQAHAREAVTGKPMRLNGHEYRRGVGSHAAGAIYIELDGKAQRFHAEVGIDDAATEQGTVSVAVYSGDRVLFESGILRKGQAPTQIDVNVNGLHTLILAMDDAGDGPHNDHVDWADARFETGGEAPKIVAMPREEPFILTPKPGPAPRINGPRICGVRPGSPFLFRIPATGTRPMQFSVNGLPAGLSLDAQTGILSGTIADNTPNTYFVTLAAQNDAGTAEREFRIVVGDTLALTPPMGWNHWYAHYNRITDAMMREAADAMVSSGMADVGYQYVNIDDCWMRAMKKRNPDRAGEFRDKDGNLIPNKYFPDMKALTQYIHAKGLKAGIYISPGPLTCAGFAGSWKHEEQDARLFAEWGFDFLKYDWCSYSNVAKDKSLEELQKPYRTMSAILKTLDRDIVLNLCQYGMGDVWTWGEEVGGNCWRTAGDLGFELRQYHDVARRNALHSAYARPGAWNDPDYLQIGYVGAAEGMGEPVPCPLTPNEQYSYMSLWCIMAAPLFFSGDMAHLDEFTLNVLCNPEAIDINQDPLGVQGGPVLIDGATEIWTKPLADGSWAVGLFNRAEISREIRVAWEAIGLKGPQHARDLWRMCDEGRFDTEYRAQVGRHGVQLLRVRPAE